MKKIISFEYSAVLAATLLAILAAAFLSGCVIASFTDFNAVKGKGDPEKHEFRVGGYSGVKVEGFCNIRYYAAPSDTVTLEVQPNLLEYFEVKVKDGDLVVHTKKRINFSSGKEPVLTISTPVLNRVVFEGAGTFTAYDKITADSLTFEIKGAGTGKAELDVTRLYADLSGAGELKLSGKADAADLNMSGAGELDALSLQTKEAKVNISGAGKVSISCSDSLRINADGMGAVEYRGSPSLNINKGGIVSIKQVN